MAQESVINPESEQSQAELSTEDTTEIATNHADTAAPAAPEPYSPFRTPPQRQLPTVVFAGPDHDAEPETDAFESALKKTLIGIGIACILGFGFLRLSGGVESANNVELLSELSAGATQGDCFTDQLRWTGCENAHAFEVFSKNSNLLSETYPGFTYRESGSPACQANYLSYVGAPYEGNSPYQIYSVYPSRAEWGEGQHWEICVLANKDGQQLVGSAAAAVWNQAESAG